MPTHPLLKHTEGEIRKIFDINVFAHFWVRIYVFNTLNSYTTNHIHKKCFDKTSEKLFKFQFLQEYLPQFIEHNKGHVVALSSMAGIVGLNNLVPYCGSKFAVRGLMEAISEEMRQDARQPEVFYSYPLNLQNNIVE